MRGRVSSGLVTAPEQRTAPCPYFAACRNCGLMEQTYAAQLATKRQAIVDAFARHGLAPEVPEVVPSPREDGYRRRATFRGVYRAEGVALGLFRAGTHELTDLPHCMVVHPELDVALDSVRGTVGDFLTGRVGEFRVEVLCDADERVGVELFVPREDLDAFEQVAAALIETGVAAVRIADESGSTLREHGDPRQFTARRVGSVACQLSLESFTQLNGEQNEQLVAHVEAMAGDLAGARVLDLYSGLGNYALPLAVRAREVLAVETSLSAVADARNSAERLGLKNLRSVRSPASQAVRELAHRRERFDLVVLNPTRAGADGVMPALAKLKPRRIIYVSCSPRTLARDLAELLKKPRYILKTIKAFDMFPQTTHVETVAVLELR